MTPTAWLFAVLVACGAGWGLTIPLTKIAVSTGHGHFGLIFWQLALGAVFLAGLTRLRGKALVYAPRQLALCTLIGLIGTVIPNSFSYIAAANLPAGVMALIIALVPMFAFPIALAMGNERFALRRFIGLVLGACAVGILLGPSASLPDPTKAVFVLVALLAPLLYGCEGNVVAKWGTRGLDPIQLLFGASWIGALIALPLALVSGQFIDPRAAWGAPETALMALSLIHALVYSGYVWMVGQAGAVFSAQVSYVVTSLGIIGSVPLLGDRYSIFI